MDDFDDEEGGELFINFAFDVKLIRAISNVLVPSEFSVSCSIERLEGASDADVELALIKWRYWFENIVSKSVVFDTNNDSAIAMMLDDTGAKRVGNIIMLSPDEPSDEIIGALFQAKMNALSGGKVVCVAIEIRSDNMHGLSFTLVGDHTSYLPETTEEWLGAPSFFHSPWWTRNDGSCIDVLVTEDTDTSAHPPWAMSLDFLDRSRSPQDRAKMAMPSRPSFSPTVIVGGKEDDDDE